MNDLFLIAINLTERCNLACAHCYMDAHTRACGSHDELRTDEVKHLLDEIAARSTETLVVLTGGEPTLRSDLVELVSHGRQRGLMMVVGSNGVRLNEARVRALKQAGAMGIGISLDSLNPEQHDRFRGSAGSWAKTLAGMDQCREQGLPFQLHFSVTEHNADEVDAMIDFAAAVGAHVLNVFFLVCTGRGESMSDITPQRYEAVLQQLLAAEHRHPGLMVRARCAPHYKRIAYQRDPDSRLTRAQGYEGGGCIAGLHCCRVTPQGAVTACPYIPDSEGTIREQPFWQIWDHAKTFQTLRSPTLEGKCGACEFGQLCGGCRARPLAMGDGLMATDPWCHYTPTGQPLIQPLVPATTADVRWSPEAEQRLSRVPGFLRRMVRKRAEDYVRERGEQVITPEHMQALAAKRFGDQFPMRRPESVKDNTVNDGAPTGAAQPSPTLAWTTEAKSYLLGIPVFLRDGVQAVAEEVARNEGRLEVNIKLLKRLDEQDNGERKLPWDADADQLLADNLAQRGKGVAMFVQPTLEAAAEREAKRRKAQVVAAEDMQRVIATDLAGVSWDADALARVRSAPEFVRGGIKKAAEFGARREGLARITSADLTRFRNRAMMKAVRRMKRLGMKDLDFAAFPAAQAIVPRLKDNAQAEQRFAAIQQYVERKRDPDGGGLGVLDRDMLAKMRAELKR